jgi:integration host factor subunit alpha
LADALFDQLGLNKREAKDLVDAFFEVVATELAQGKSVKISGFGNFEVHTKSARPGRNPQTGEAVVIISWKLVTSKPMKVSLLRQPAEAFK